MSPRSRSISSHRSYSASPKREHGQRNSRRYSHEGQNYNYRSQSHVPQSLETLSNGDRHARCSAGSKSSSRSLSSRHHRRGDEDSTRSKSRSHSGSRNYKDEKRRSTREKPAQSYCIGVFGLSVITTQQQIREIFSKFGPIEKIQVVIDAQTGRSRGFCFIYYEKMADAKAAKDDCCGLEVDGRRIRVDYSITDRPHSPTPGVYKGRALRNHRDRDRDYDRYRSRSNRRCTSASYRRRHYDRSRSRSYSPRRFRY